MADELREWAKLGAELIEVDRKVFNEALQIVRDLVGAAQRRREERRTDRRS